MKLSLHRRVGAVALTGALAISLAACGSDNATGTATPSGDATSAASDLSGDLNAAGSSAQESAMGAWRSGFQSTNSGVNVNYDPVGSGGGRTQFLDGGVQFAGSDAALSDEEIAKSKDTCVGGQAIDLPAYISPIAVTFNLEGIKELNLSSAVIAGIFNQKITNWNAPEIAADNPGVTLPDLAISPVNRSDDSGTTKNFTDYLATTAPDAWPYKADGVFPVAGGQSAQGTSGVIQTVQGGNGTITYADSSKVGELGTAKIKVGDAWVGHSPKGAAIAVDASPRVEGRIPTDLAIKIDRSTTAAGAYPLVLTTYEIACTVYADANDAALVKAFLSYVVSADGQAAAASAAGSAPISTELATEVQAAIDSIKAAA
ncbi:MAG: phosphate ABC transporter substrate-binding protein PstS [Cellulomonas sp.]